MKWYLETGPYGDVVVSTRVRLARNIADYPFPCRLDASNAQKVLRDAHGAIASSPLAPEFEYIDMGKLTPARAMSLSEFHLISPEFAKERNGRALRFEKDNTVSVMLNEEDHIRIQVLKPGMQLPSALECANKVDDVFDESLNYAFDEKLGYLTQCPTNLGTGLRASLMLHLPAITQTGVIQGVANALSKLGLTMRGTYGEGSRAMGSFFQISNQVTLGITEDQAIENLEAVAEKLINQELSLREKLRNSGPAFSDKICRSYGILLTARILSSDEFMTLISNVRLGITMKILGGLSLGDINGLIYDVQPATLTAAAGRRLSPQRDELRAKVVRERISGKA